VANFHGLIFFAVVLLSSWFPVSSYAAIPATATYTYFAGSSGGTPGGSGATALAACQASAANYVHPSYHISGVTATETICNNPVYSNSTGAYVTTFTPSVTKSAATYACPANSTLSGSSCSCNSGFSESGFVCLSTAAVKCSAASGGVDLFTGFGSLPTFGASFCPSDGAASSCASKVTGGYCVVKGGVKTCTHEVTYTGDTCTPLAPSPTEPSPVPTPCKGTYGQVNGVDVCLPLGTDPAATVETGKKTETTTTPADGGAASTTKTEQSTKCAGSTCTTETKTTTTVGGGTPTVKTETKSEDKNDFCKDNPRNALCISSKYTGSACGAKPACDGDAIQCAVADFTFKTQCALTTAPDPETTPALKAYNMAAAQLQGDQTTGEDVLSTVNLGPSAFDQSSPLGAAVGLSDVIVTVWQTPVTLPFSSLNQWLERIGWLFQGVTFLLCARIVLRG
jgi:hypothetical protein